MTRNLNLKQLYVILIGELEVELDRAKEALDRKSAEPALFVVLLYSAHENFLKTAFARLLHSSGLASDAKEVLDGKVGNFSLKSDFPTFCSFFLPEKFEKSAIRKMLIDSRNAYAHRFFDEEGKIASYYDARYLISAERLDDFFQYSKDHMLLIADAVEEQVASGADL